VDYGRTVSEAWWMRTGRRGMFVDKFSPSLYQFLVNRRFGWKDKSKGEGNESPLEQSSLDELQAEFRRLANKQQAS